MKNVKEWSKLDYYSNLLKVDEENRLNFISAIVTRLYNLNKETKTLENKNLDRSLKQEHLTIIKKSIQKLRENNETNKHSSFEQKYKSKNGIEYKETLFFIEYPECVVDELKKYQRAHMIDYDILSSLNLSAEYSMRSLKNLTLLIWTFEKTCIYASSRVIKLNGSEYPGNKQVSLNKQFTNTEGIQNVKVFRKNQTDSSPITIAHFEDFRKKLYDIKELLVSGINNQKDESKNVLELYRKVYTDIETATGHRMNNEVLSKILHRVLSTIV